MQTYQDIFSYIIAQENDYKQPIDINDSYKWSMRDHIKTTDLYNNSQLLNVKDDFTPVKNITRPILNLQHRTEDIEVKDVQIYVNDPEKYHLSMLVKKYHDDVFAVENDMDTFFDELNISRIDQGGGLSKKLNKPRPEVVPLQTIAFCDQSDLLSGPIGIRHYYSADQLLDMRQFGWGNEKNGATISVEDLIALSSDTDKKNEDGQSIKTPGRYIEVYEVHGNLPRVFAEPTDDSGEYETRIYIVAFYTKKGDNKRNGVTLYTKPEKESPFKLTKRDPVYGRALGFGGAEELFEAQVWTNYDMIRMQDMLDAASKTILKYIGPGMTNRTKIRDMDSLDIIELGMGEDIGQVDTFPRNMQLFEKSMAMWDAHAKDIGAAQDVLQGKEPSSGTPFASLQAQIMQGIGLHEYRRQQYAKHLEEIYTDWVIPHIEKEICKGAQFLSELTLKEMQDITDAMVTNLANKQIVEMVINGEEVTEEAVDLFKETVRAEFKKKGNTHWIKILKDDFKDSKFSVKVSIAGKSKNLSKMADNMTNIFRQIFANPQQFAATMQVPAAATAFNELLEYSGMSPLDFNDFGKLAEAPMAPQAAPMAPAMAQ